MRIARVTILAALLFGGCQTIHEVKVDAIRDPRAGPPASYQLVVAAPTGDSPGLAALVERSVRAGLAARGCFAAPAGTLPDQIIAVSYGVGPARLAYVYKARDMLTIDLWGKIPPKGGAVPLEVREKYLRLSARAPAPAGSAPAPELWSVHLVVEDEDKDFAASLPALATALLDYIGEHNAAETTMKIKEGDARRALRELTK